MGSPGTGAFVGIDQVNAGAPVLARLGETFIDLFGAVGPHVSWQALKKRGRARKGGWGGCARGEKKRKKKERKKKKKKRGKGRREGKVESMADMKRLWFFCLPGCFPGLHPVKAGRSLLPQEISITDMFVFYL